MINRAVSSIAGSFIDIRSIIRSLIALSSIAGLFIAARDNEIVKTHTREIIDLSTIDRKAINPEIVRRRCIGKSFEGLLSPL